MNTAYIPRTDADSNVTNSNLNNDVAPPAGYKDNATKVVEHQRAAGELKAVRQNPDASFAERATAGVQELGHNLAASACDMAKNYEANHRVFAPTSKDMSKQS
jgi:hypothetical protein